MDKLCTKCSEKPQKYSEYKFDYKDNEGMTRNSFIICDRCMGNLIRGLLGVNPPNNYFD